MLAIQGAGHRAFLVVIFVASLVGIIVALTVVLCILAGILGLICDLANLLWAESLKPGSLVLLGALGLVAAGFIVWQCHYWRIGRKRGSAGSNYVRLNDLAYDRSEVHSSAMTVVVPPEFAASPDKFTGPTPSGPDTQSFLTSTTSSPDDSRGRMAGAGRRAARLVRVVLPRVISPSTKHRRRRAR
jgi:hypothetical protein